jgi:hypothetical protein
VTGIEVLQLALLGLALFLVGARLRVLALRRRPPALPFEHDFEAPMTVRRVSPQPRPRASRRDEWSFPDPDEPAPTGLLPSTATARRRARAAAMSSDRD